MTVPDDLETENQPPLSVPLQRFVVSLVFLVAGGVVGTVAAVEPGSGVEAAHVHLLVVGWVCVTIMGAMTQFVPVWSGTSLHSRLLARLQLVLVGVGVVGLAALFSTGAYSSVVLPGSLVVAGFYVFIYNVGRSLPEIDPR
ncbi:MAG: hypothetical protein SV760_08065, partial [Halobacteria archaeon]|nr:hypothetical protein [Halobacteria archaeon]